MGLTAMVVGSVSGFGMQMMNNALQKVPLSRSEYDVPFFPLTPLNKLEDAPVIPLMY
jgi:hypothetical protein